MRRSVKKILCLVTVITSIYGCKLIQNSATKEAWNTPNAPIKFKLDPINLNQLQKADHKKGSITLQAWSDDYWPLKQAGAAKRWLNTSINEPFNFWGNDFNFIDKVTERNYKQPNFIFKLYYQLKTQDPDKNPLTGNQLTEYNDNVNAIFSLLETTTVRAAFQAALKLDTQDQPQQEDLDTFETELRNIDGSLIEFSSIKPLLEKLHDQLQNRIKLGGIADIDKYLESINNDHILPWQHRIAVSFAEKYDYLTNDVFAFTRSELLTYLGNYLFYESKDIDWGWMGHCHGWAAVAHLYDPPNHAVLVNKGGKEVLMTEGDIRGLLTKAAADNSFAGEEQFLGTRCNEKTQDIPRDSNNRIIDAHLGTWNKTDKQFSQPVAIKILNNKEIYPAIENKIEDSEYEFMFQFTGDSAQQVYWLRAWGEAVDHSSKIYNAAIFSTRQNESNVLIPDVLIASTNIEHIGLVYNSDNSIGPNQDLEKAKADWEMVLTEVNHPQGLSKLNIGHFKYYKRCRDVNAGSFHSTLVQLMSDGYTKFKGVKASSFVMDKTRSDQVWNHPINSFESFMGEKTALAIDEIEDPYKAFRALGTTSIVDVYTRVDYAIEVGKALYHYEVKDEKESSVWYHYTLEFDKQNNLLGGEWHGKVRNLDSRKFETTPKSGKDLLQHLDQLVKKPFASIAEAPDFLWRYQPGTKISSGEYLKSEIFEKIYQCSKDSNNLQKTTLPVEQVFRDQNGGKQINTVTKEIAYKKCQI